MESYRWIVPVAFAVVRRPSLWSTLVALGFRHRSRGWFKKKPFLPVPDGRWLRFRYETAFGDPSGRPDGHDVKDFLDWVKTWEGL